MPRKNLNRTKIVATVGPACDSITSLTALKRAGVAVKFTRGHHPKAKISFQDTLPLGVESREEFFNISVPEDADAKTIIVRLNRELPRGLEVLGISPALKSKKTRELPVHYTVALLNGHFDGTRLDEFLKAPEWIIKKAGKKGRLQELERPDDPGRSR